MQVRDLKELLNNFSEDDYIIARAIGRLDNTPDSARKFNIVEVKNVQDDYNSSRMVSIELKEDNSVEIGAK